MSFIAIVKHIFGALDSAIRPRHFGCSLFAEAQKNGDTLGHPSLLLHIVKKYNTCSEAVRKQSTHVTITS